MTFSLSRNARLGRKPALAYFSQYEMFSVKSNLIWFNDMTATPAFSTRFPIEWGDCDAAGIVFFPNYFRWCDAAFQRLLKSRGHTQATLARTYGIIGTPLVDAGASFHAPARYDEELAVDVAIAEWKRSTFRVTYRGMVGERRVLSGHDVRAFVARGEDGRLSSVTIPDAFKAGFAG
jgi:4-hydroxybenzoyl-CoA thioesterase